MWAALLMGAPLIVWGALRWFAFGATTGIAVIDASPGAYPVLHYVRQMLRWPFCIGFLDGPAIDLIKQGDLAGVSSGAYLQIVLNAGCWGLFAAAVWSRLSEVCSGANRTSDGDRFEATAIWAGWVLLFVVATSAEARFMFHQVNRDRILATRIGDTFVQGECRYRFPDLDVPERGTLDYGARLEVECDAAGDTVPVYFDTLQHRYARSRRPAATTARQTPR